MTISLTHPITWFFDLRFFVMLHLSQTVSSIIFLFQSKSKAQSYEQGSTCDSSTNNMTSTKRGRIFITVYL
jgi:hypothetical protein